MIIIRKEPTKILKLKIECINKLISRISTTLLPSSSSFAFNDLQKNLLLGDTDKKV